MLDDAIGHRGGSESTPVQVALQNKWVILAFAIAVAALTWLGLATLARPLYSASASVMIDARQIQLGGQTGLLPNQTLDDNWVRTQMEALNSPRIAAKVVQTLDLVHDTLFKTCPDQDGVLSRVRALLQHEVTPRVCTPSLEAAAKTLLGSMSFSNDRQSYIIKVGASVPNPALAARIANAYAETYVEWLRDANRTVAERADALLTPYLAELHVRARAADAAVDQYQQAHNLVPLRDGRSGSGLGTTLNSQSLAAMNSELSLVTSLLAEKQSVLEQVRELQRSGGRVEAITPTLASPVIQSLLSRRAELAGALDEIETRYGNANGQVIAAKAKLARNEQQIRFEVDQIIAGVSSEAAALTIRKASLVTRVANLQVNVAGENRDDVVLQELQRTAQAENSVYQTMLVHLKEIGAAGLVQRGEAQIVVEATVPEIPTSPKKNLLVMGAFLASLGCGTGIAFALSFVSPHFRDIGQVEDETGLPVFGLFPESRRRPAQDMVIDAPLSLEADSIHAVLNQVCGHRRLAAGRGGHVVLVTSALPSEGKTSFSVALGRSAMQSGQRAFVLDCDLRRPALERAIRGGDDVCAEHLDVEAITPAALVARSSMDARSGLRFLSLAHYMSNPRGLAGWPELPGLLNELRARYDLIVLDTPPVLAVPDVLQLAPLADQVLLMVDWRATPRVAVTTAMVAMQRAGMPATGVVMSKVNLRRYTRVSTGNAPYLKHYRAYHQPLART